MTFESAHRFRLLGAERIQARRIGHAGSPAFLMLLVFLITQPLLSGSILPRSLNAGAPAPLEPVLTSSPS